MELFWPRICRAAHNVHVELAISLNHTTVIVYTLSETGQSSSDRGSAEQRTAYVGGLAPCAPTCGNGGMRRGTVCGTWVPFAGRVGIQHREAGTYRNTERG